jgi:hypothetical protein
MQRFRLEAAGPFLRMASSPEPFEFVVEMRTNAGPASRASHHRRDLYDSESFVVDLGGNVMLAPRVTFARLLQVGPTMLAVKSKTFGRPLRVRMDLLLV